MTVCGGRNSKFSQHLLENVHFFGKINNIMKILQLMKKWLHMDTTEKYYIYKETTKGNHLNDQHRVSSNIFFEVTLKNGKVIQLGIPLP
jgi:hypothetical protein